MNTHTLPPEDPILTWKARQHPHVERGMAWYSIAAVAFVGMIVYSIVTAAWTFTILLTLVSVLYWRVHKDIPEEKTMRIWKRGFAVEDVFYDWSKCKGYWIMRGETFSELHIEKNNGGEVKVQTGEMNPYHIHETLAGLLPELEDRREHILDTIIRICKL